MRHRHTDGPRLSGEAAWWRRIGHDLSGIACGHDWTVRRRTVTGRPSRLDSPRERSPLHHRLPIRPAHPWLIYLEDNEDWIARQALSMVGLHEGILLQHSEAVISTWTPSGLSHVLHYRDFIGLADGAVVIQDKLRADVPPWVPCATVHPGVDLEAFRPMPPDAALRERLGLAPGERVLVYPGGLNDFTRPGIETLCRAVHVINERGTPCRLVRTGPVALDFLDRLPSGAASRVLDLGIVGRDELPALLALADVLVQPGRNDPFDDLRLPGKLPEFFASGRPVVLPAANIAELLRDGEDALTPGDRVARGNRGQVPTCCSPTPASLGALERRGAALPRHTSTPPGSPTKLEEALCVAVDTFDAVRAAAVWPRRRRVRAHRVRLVPQASSYWHAPRCPPLGCQRIVRGAATARETAHERERGLERAFGSRLDLARLREEASQDWRSRGRCTARAKLQYATVYLASAARNGDPRQGNSGAARRVGAGRQATSTRSSPQLVDHWPVAGPREAAPRSLAGQAGRCTRGTTARTSPPLPPPASQA